ncbi:MAG: hypothetical protein LBV69_03155 [Bacteroidales bacterium]|jgi:hypothetical protein|nr:hypothetical protein [Bacteroidales bacterium]
MNKEIKNIKISLLQGKFLLMFSCYLNACWNFFVSLIKKEEKFIKISFIIQKIKYKFAEKIKYYANFNNSKHFLQIVHNKHCFT